MNHFLNKILLNNFYSDQNDNLKKALFALQTTSEQEEEMITNSLLKKISTLQKEKEYLLLKVEEEEEMITNQLQKKLKQLQKEKIELENTLEQEQESMVNRLQKQLDDLMNNQTPAGRMRVASSERKLSQIGPERRHSNTSSCSSINDVLVPSTNVVELLRAENNTLKAKLNEQKSLLENWIERCNDQYSRVFSLLEPTTSIPSSLPPAPIISSSPSGIIDFGCPEILSPPSFMHQRRTSAGALPLSPGVNSSGSVSTKRLHARIPLG